MIHFSKVGKRYPGGYQALENISFQIPRGQMGFLTGPSGAGKSTLLKLIACIERPSGGQATVNGHDLAKLGTRRIPYFRRELGIIFQDYRLLYDHTVFDNIALPLIVAGFSHLEVGRRVRAALDKVGLLGKERLKPVVLSGGEQQRVGIARAIVHRPALLLADEPTGNLDPELAREIMALFVDLNRVGMTVLIASHDLGMIERLGLPALRLESGRVTHLSAELQA